MNIKILFISIIIMLEGILSGGCEIYADILDNISDNEKYINESLDTEDNTTSSNALNEFMEENTEKETYEVL